MKHNTLAFLLIVVSVFIVASSCKESITDSRPRIIRPPQDMIWTADTIRGLDQYAQLTPRNLYVFSANDAWLTCWSDIARGLIWHWDGKSWNESDIRKDVGGMRIQDVCGYSSSDLWACGYSGEEIFLAHYNGTKWTKYNTNGIKGELIKMCKDADGNIWACGRNGVIMKYDKTKWNYESFKTTNSTLLNSEFFFQSITSFANKIHLLLTNIRTIPWLEKHYHIIGQFNNWTLVDSIIIDSPAAKIKWGYWGLHSGTSLWSNGILGVWKNVDNSWVQKISISNSIRSVYEATPDYVIAAGDSKTILYSTGINWTSFADIFNINDSKFVFTNVWTNGYETIICGFGTFGTKDKLVIWRGK